MVAFRVSGAAAETHIVPVASGIVSVLLLVMFTVPTVAST